MKSSPETKRPSVLLRWTFPCILSFFIVEFKRHSPSFSGLMNVFNPSNRILTQSDRRAPPLWLLFYQKIVLGQTSLFGKNQSVFGEILAHSVI